ncbi:hypothetical protein CMV_021664 [Castanea mollissima]|uniref:Uncharacterized protein n=1 Tax=Castanea mollissima TaxID=60419 RepID=A0A8J4QTF8_9ROSI|nr:hypothetical protein CMV_021664 [Castanea mollissima]
MHSSARYAHYITNIEKHWRTEMRMISMCCVSKSLEDRTSPTTYHVLNLLLNFILSCCILFTMYTLFILLLLLVCFKVIVF